MPPPLTALFAKKFCPARRSPAREPGGAGSPPTHPPMASPTLPACPRCGAAAVATAAPAGGHPPPSPAPPSQPNDEAGPSPDAADVGGGDAGGGVVAACTACGFILDDTPLDGRPPPRRGEDRGEGAGRGGGGAAGIGGRASGAGEGVFVSAHAGAVGAAGECRWWGS